LQRRAFTDRMMRRQERAELELVHKHHDKRRLAPNTNSRVLAVTAPMATLCASTRDVSA
jgi:hypothetical protein